jgi:hypothetical protein
MAFLLPVTSEAKSLAENEEGGKKIKFEKV